MSAKQQTQRDDKVSSKRRSPRSTTEALDILAQRQPRPGTVIQLARLAPGLLTPRDVQQLQRMVGNRAVGQFLDSPPNHAIQRAGVVAKVKQLESELKKETVQAVRKWAFGSKKKGHTTWERILANLKDEEKYWDTVRDHVLLGEDEKPPKGYHSTKLSNAAYSEVVGEKAPASAGDSVPYKRWTRQKGDDTYDHLKISSFFPDNWPEDKIQAAVLLRKSGEEHQVQSSFALKEAGDTIYPDLKIGNPPQPKKK